MTDQPEIGEVWECICRGKPELHTIDGSMSYETGVSCRSTSERPVGLMGPPTPATFLRAFPDADAVMQDRHEDCYLGYAELDGIVWLALPEGTCIDWGPHRTEASQRIYVRPEKRGEM